MIIKLDTSVFRLARPKAEAVRKTVEPITREQWINADRIVMTLLFVAVIVGSIIF